MSAKPRSTTLPDLLHELEALYPEREAIVDGTRRYTYRELNASVRACAAGLRTLGAGPGDKVAVIMGNRAEWIIAAMAATCLGGVAVAVNTWWTAREIAYALDHAEARYVICTPTYMKHDYVKTLEGLRADGKLPSLRAIVGVGQEIPGTWHSWDSILESGQQDANSTDPVAIAPDDVAFLLYTSGSTSQPKGVQLVHRSLIENVWNIGERQRVTEHDRLWLAVSLFWGFGCSNAMMNLLTHGGCIVLQESFEAGAALRLIEQERCSVIYGTPNMIQALVEHPDRSSRDLSSLRSGATLGSPEQVRRAALLGAHAICNVYGLTEIYGNSHVSDAEDPLELRLQSCGRPLPGVSQKIVDPASGQAVGVGQTGEIRVKGHVTKGYFKNGEQTALALDSEGYFKTGDLGCIDAQGNLFFKGRLKELVKTGGMNVAPAEIEAVLMAHPEVQLAVVVGVPDPKRDELLAAVIVPRGGCNPTEQAIRDFCRRELAAYKVPALIRFASESALPLTTTGKVQKNRIAEEFFRDAVQAA